jgi:tetratricopeptide (TPR) repeat protein
MNPSILVALASLVPPALQERSPFSAQQYGVVLELPGMERVRTTTNITYMRSGERDLQLDVSLPADARAPLPAVVFLNGIGDQLPDRVKEWGIYASWPKLIAASGMAGVSMDCDGARIQESLEGVFAFLAREGARHGIDGTRIGVYAASANCTETSRFLLRAGAPASVKAAVFYYGWPEAPVMRRDLPVLTVTAESDLAGSIERLNELWPRVLATGAPWTFELATDLPHAFDAFEDTDASRRTIQRAIAFWKSHLEPVPQPSWEPTRERAIVAAMYGNDQERSVRLLGEWIADHPDVPHGYAARGQALCRMQRGNEGKSDLEKAIALGDESPGVVGCLGMVLASQQQHAEAVTLMARARAAGWQNPQLLSNLGHSLLVLGGRDADAVEAYEAALGMGMSSGAQTLGAASYNLACGYARLGRIADALSAIERAVEQRFGQRRTYETDPDLAPLRDEERFLIALDRLAPG